MGIQITTPAESRDLTTVPAVLAVLGEDADPALVGRLIRAATDAIERYCGRTFARQTYVETLDGNASRELLLRNTPIVGTPTIVCESAPVADFEVSDADAGILYRALGWERTGDVYWFAEPSAVWPTGARRYAVTYEAGYLLPGQDGRDLPGDIENACVETVCVWYRRAGEDPNLRQKKVDDLTLVFAAGSEADHNGLPPYARAVLPVRLV